MHKNPKTLSGIETQSSNQSAIVQVPGQSEHKNPKTLSGIEMVEVWRGGSQPLGMKTLKPYQGLKPVNHFDDDTAHRLAQKTYTLDIRL